MATAQVPPADNPPAGGAPRRTAPTRSDRSPWNWLLLLPIVIPLWVPMYNRREPLLFGWPFFYWGQLAFVALGVLVTSMVYLATRRSGQDRAAAREAIARDERS